MPRQTDDQKITTPTQRARLTPRRKPYYRRLTDTIQIGYRRQNTLPGTWVTKTRADDGTYTERKLDGIVADDVGAANGVDVLTFDQACAKARGVLARPAEELTLQAAADEWAGGKLAENDRPSARVKITLTARRIPKRFPEGQMLHKLTVKQIREWRDGYLIPGADDERQRARRSTANRELAALKAICNLAVRNHRLDIARPWDDVPKFGRAEAFGKRVRVLTQDEREAWLAGAPDTPTRNMIHALLATGCRSGELVTAGLRDLSGRRLTVTGKTGTRTMVLSPGTAAFLAGLTQCKHDPDRPLLPAPSGERWTEEGLIDAVARATSNAKLEGGVTAYAARHSYITEHLARGVPVVAVAKQCGTSADMIEKTYANFIATDLEIWFGAEVVP
ncbi:site-specific integrase [Paracoccus sp. PAR01]|uniref:tyrosine-type recombinase/integrase n=1 Tax=Paracoccus sp. PAR01 TaxID=2769282 RepID=UPI0017819FFE|nr:site-specific integrase [Paracoccus sp. PAR01]MBD9526204.1 site-specific integrase [Paracoccus sp. PAR01]